MREDRRVFRLESRWLVALTLLWLVVPWWLLRLGTDVADLVDDPPVATLRTLALVLPAVTACLLVLHGRANGVPRPLTKALLATVLLEALWLAAWIWTIDGRRGSGPGLAVPLCVAALLVGALVGSRPAAENRPTTDQDD
jgi:hypothetical protein